MGNPLDSTITTCDRPGRLDFTSTGKLMNLDIRPKGLMTVLLPPIGPVIKRIFAKQHDNYKKLSEEQAE